MQTLYTLDTLAEDESGNSLMPGRLLQEKLNHSLDLFIISILYTFRIAQYAEKDAHQRASKYLPTKEDLSVSTKISGNEFLWRVLSSDSFQEKLKTSRLDEYVDEKWIRKLYQLLIDTPEYQEYIVESNRIYKKEKAIMRFIWVGVILKNENLLEYFSDELPGWDDDWGMTGILMENFFKNPANINFLQLVSDEKNEFAQSLLRTVREKRAYCQELIRPKLVNWDSDRVALIDLLLLRMGVCELLYFPTIPTKVTINEYIELGKQYSTLQSGQFINGVLDNILKELVKEGKIQKRDRAS